MNYDTNICVRTGFYTKEAFQIFNAFRFLLRRSLKQDGISSAWFSKIFPDTDKRYKEWAWWAPREIHLFKVEKMDDGEVALLWPTTFTYQLKDVKLGPSYSDVDKLLYVLATLAWEARGLFDEVTDVPPSTRRNADRGYTLVFARGIDRKSFKSALEKYGFRMNAAQIAALVGTPNDIFKTMSITTFKNDEAAMKARHEKELTALANEFGAKQKSVANKYNEKIDDAYQRNATDEATELEQRRNAEHYEILKQAEAAEVELKKKHKAEFRAFRDELNRLKAM